MLQRVANTSGARHLAVVADVDCCRLIWCMRGTAWPWLWLWLWLCHVASHGMATPCPEATHDTPKFWHLHGTQNDLPLRRSDCVCVWVCSALIYVPQVWLPLAGALHCTVIATPRCHTAQIMQYWLHNNWRKGRNRTAYPYKVSTH